MCCCDFESVQANECMHNAPQHCTARERQKRQKKERKKKHLHTRNYHNVALSHAPSLCLRVSRSTLASTIWCISNIVYLHLHTNCISLFVSKVVHASQINATQTLSHTQTHTAYSRTAPYQLFLSAINARAGRIFACTINIRDIFVRLLLLNSRSKLSMNNTNVCTICIRFRSKPKFLRREKNKISWVGSLMKLLRLAIVAAVAVAVSEYRYEMMVAGQIQFYLWSKNR